MNYKGTPQAPSDSLTSNQLYKLDCLINANNVGTAVKMLMKSLHENIRKALLDQSKDMSSSVPCFTHWPTSEKPTNKIVRYFFSTVGSLQLVIRNSSAVVLYST